MSVIFFLLTFIAGFAVAFSIHRWRSLKWRKVEHDEGQAQTKRQVSNQLSMQEREDGRSDKNRTEDLQKQLNNLYLVNELSQQITSSLSISESFNRLFHTINSMMNASVVELVVYEETGSRLLFTNKNYPKESQPAATYNHISDWCFRNNKEVYLEEAEQDFGRYVFHPLVLPDGTPAKSLMAFPVHYKERIAGTLCIIGLSANAFELFHKDMIRLLLPFVGVAINNAFTHQQIIELQQRAERSEHFMQVFLANMSHEIRTPMNAVMGMTNILLQKDPKPGQLKYLDAIQRSSENLLVILNDILDLSKIEAGKIELEEIEFSLREVVANIESILRHKAEEKGLVLSVQIEESIPEVLIGDPTRLTQILINLVGNAIKFTEKGSVRIAVRPDEKTQREESFRQFLNFTIEDTGIGMTAEQQKKLFSEYSQASTDTARKYGGTGLGLNISKQLVQLQGGSIKVDSVSGKGTTFSFVLPFVQSKNKEVVVKRKTASQEVLQSLQGVRILLADDNEYNRITVIETLRLKIADVHIDEAMNGLQAIEMARLNNYDLVLMDLVMPVMDGLEATKIIRKEFPSPKCDIPVVALTASVIKSEMEKCINSGMNGFIPKPFQEYDLFQAIYDALNRKEAQPFTVDLKKTVHDSTHAHINLNYLREFTEGDEVRMQRHIRLFLSRIPEHLVALKAGVESDDYDAVRITSHSMKPLLEMMGVEKGREVAEFMEQCCVSKTGLEQLPELVKEMESICAPAIRELKNHAVNA